MINETIQGLRPSSHGATAGWPDAYRPRFHFTAAANWINDPNGVCWLDGRYHLYYLYYPNAA